MSDTARYAFTIFTPTFNRAHTLPRVYDSLHMQTVQDFEWLIVDDGSTDETRALVRTWVEDAPFPVKYVHQENSGKHVAENLAMQHAEGRFITTVDSDDWLLPQALEILIATWETIPPEDRERFVGVVGLAVDPQGTVVGTPFPTDVLDTTYTELAALTTGDKAGFGRTEVARQFRYPVIPGERLMLEFLVYNRMAKHYRIRCVNRPIKTVEYQPTGLSASKSMDFVRNPRTSKLYFLEQLSESLPPGQLIRAHANHTRYALHASLAAQSLRDTPSKGLWVATFPLAVLLYARDQVRLRRAGP